MKSNYKRLGDYIEQVDARNVERKDIPLLGVSINKYFMPSVANVIGTDLANYKIVKKYQFVCSLMQVSRDEKIPISCLMDYDTVIVSPAYMVFEITEPQKLSPVYLSMWFMRSEFDREASFIGVGGIRGSMTWDDFCNMKFPVPPIEKQRAIVKEYETITDRIALKKKINDKLEYVIQTIFKSWFIDFDNILYSDYIDFEYGRYPSSWLFSPLSSIIDIRDGTHDSPPPVKKGYSLVTSVHLLPYSVDLSNTYFIDENEYRQVNKRSKVDTGDILFSMIGTIGIISYVSSNKINFAIKNVGLFKTSKRPELIEYVLSYLKSQIVDKYVVANLAGSTQSYLSLAALRNIPFYLPPLNILQRYSNLTRPLYSLLINNTQEIKCFREIQAVLLSRLTEDDPCLKK
jgi:type I restriction enzyme S subunit